LRQLTTKSNAFAACLDSALRHLKTRDRFRQELFAWLVQKGFEESVANQAVDHLERKGILSEERALAATLRKSEGKRALGNERLAVVLQAAGASEEAIGAAIGERDEVNLALESLAGKRRDPAQASRFLASRGFSQEAIETVLAQLYGERDFPPG
jgi:SOS response regulatory protein OraA/RecX